MACIFCAILQGREPASFIYQDDYIAAFMDIRPVRPGQTIVIPRLHVDHFCDLPDDLAVRVFLFGQQLARTLRELLQPPRVGMVVHGFGVPHAHINVLPLHHTTDITSARNSRLEDREIRFRFENVELAERSELDKLAEKIQQRLAQ
jgi:histidine triad (HIT) family protein